MAAPAKHANPAPKPVPVPVPQQQGLNPNAQGIIQLVIAPVDPKVLAAGLVKANQP